ncbi:YggT family protein [Microbacterium sediminicola]|uniref:YggT family protein n=1 Tax=Microbacterium sediminicola TaxID=415210 RepID=A0ABN2HXM4_9MICO
MNVIQIIAGILNALLLIYVLVLLARLVLEWIPVFDRQWRPRGAMLVVAEGVYTVTDPPIRLLRRFIPPLRIGSIQFDFAFVLTMLICFILLSVTRAFAG